MELGRVLVTADHDFLQLADERAEQSEHHPGLIFILPRTSVGKVVRAITLIAQVLDPADLENWVEWVP